MSSEIRLRFAPSPTGQLHVGNARTALFNYLFARHLSGVFVLRIEDTDIERSTAESETSILEDLLWLGLNWDEGPDRGGDFGPYRQSERKDLYRTAAARLRETGLAYPCFCTPQELEEERQQALKSRILPRYRGKCLDLTPEEIKRREVSGQKPVLRFSIPEGDIIVKDLVRGRVAFDSAQIGDFVLVRSNGLPSYNFAVVVDDAQMRISHVIRGEDHLSNTPKQLLLYQALGWNPPLFAHLPMILGPDHNRLSKRHGVTSVHQYRQEGFLPQALANFLALLGWSPGDDREVMTIDELVRDFDLKRVAKSAAIFNPEKLAWMNGVYIRKTPLEELWEQAGLYLAAGGFFPAASLPGLREQLLSIMDLVKGSLKTLREIVNFGPMFFCEDPGYSPEILSQIRSPESRRVLEALLERITEEAVFTPEVFRNIMKSLQKVLQLKGKKLYQPVRMAISGREHGPELDRLVCLIGKDLVRRRLIKFVASQKERDT